MKKRILIFFLFLSLIFSSFDVLAAETTYQVNSGRVSTLRSSFVLHDKVGNTSGGGFGGTMHFSPVMSLSGAYNYLMEKLPEDAYDVKFYLTDAWIEYISGYSLSNGGGAREDVPSGTIDWQTVRFSVAYQTSGGDVIKSTTSFEGNTTPMFLGTLVSGNPKNNLLAFTTNQPLYVNGVYYGGYAFPFPNVYITTKFHFTLSMRYNLSDNTGDTISGKLDVTNEYLQSIDKGITSANGKLDDVNAGLNDVNAGLNNLHADQQAQLQQNQQFRDEDKQSANAMEGQLNGFITDTQNSVKSKWEILWYPISFTNDLLSVFTNGTQTSAYQRTYAFVEGYAYDEESGGLYPIINRNRLINPRVVGGTTITFPSYTLPVLNLKLWDSYTYDLSSLKDQFPVAFNLLYLSEGVVEVYLFVSFLRDKYEEVFGS